MEKQEGSIQSEGVPERDRMEETLRKSEERYRFLFESSPALNLIIDADGRIRDVTKSFAERLGYSNDEILGRRALEFVATGQREKVAAVLEMAFKGEDTPAMDVDVYAKDGSVHTVFFSPGQMVSKEEGQPTSVLFTGVDVTSNVRAQEALRRSEHEKGAILDTMSELVIYQDAENRIVWTNRRAGESVGLAPEQLVGRHCYEVWHQRTKPCPQCPVVKAIETRQPQENEIATPDGRAWLIRGYPVRDAKDHVEGIVEVVLEITERKRMEEEIRSLARFPAENPNPVLRLDKNGIVLATNEASKTLLAEWKPEVGQTAPKFWCDLAADALSTRLSRNIDVEFGGRFYTFLVKPIMEVGYVNLYGRDITERKRMDEELRRYSEHLEELVAQRSGELVESEKRSRELADLLPQIVFEIDEKGSLTFLNHVAFASTGYSEDDLRRGLNAFQMFVPEDHDRARQKIRKLLTGEKGSSDEYTVLRKDGSRFLAVVYAAPVIRENRAVGVRGIVVDITERKRTENALRESEDRYRRLLESMSEHIAVLDSEWRYLLANDALTRSVKIPREQLLGKKLTEVFPDIEKSAFFDAGERVMKSRKPATVTSEYAFEDGRTGWFETHIYPVPEGIMYVANDITERKQMEKTLLKSQRLATIGELAAMVGHDLRNPLAGITGAAYYLRKKLGRKTSKKEKEMLQLIEQEIEHSDKIINDLLEYSKEIRLELTQTDAKSITRDVLTSMKIPSGTRIVDSTKKEPTMELDVDKMRRVLVNLIRNAVDAMPTGGTLRITSRKGSVSKPY